MSLLSQVDPKVLTVSLVILVILCILSIIKKMIKLVVTFVIIAVFVGILMPIASDIQSKYNFSIDNGVIQMTIEGEEISFDKLECKEINVSDNGDSYTVEIILNNTTPEIGMPKFMLKPLEAFADKCSIPVNVE